MDEAEMLILAVAASFNVHGNNRLDLLITARFKRQISLGAMRFKKSVTPLTIHIFAP